MSLRKSFVALACASAFVLPAANAATATAAASFSQLTVYVFDLNPLDNVSPSFSILNGPSTYTYAQLNGGASDNDCCTANHSSSVSDAARSMFASVTSTAPTLAAGALVAPDVVMTAARAYGAQVSLMSSSVIDASFLAQGSATQNSGWSSSQASMQVEIGAGTLVLLSVVADVSATASSTAVSNLYASSYAQVGFSQSFNGAYVGSYGYMNAYTGFGYAEANPSVSATLSGSYANFGANAVSLYSSAYASSSVQAPIPEPETYALMMLGLGLVGWATKRRQR